MRKIKPLQITRIIHIIQHYLGPLAFPPFYYATVPIIHPVSRFNDMISCHDFHLPETVDGAGKQADSENYGIV
jgi:hypothetical protein